jgi:hypothetical protein
MVAHDAPAGLIAAVRANAKPPLDAVADGCGWPLLLAATPKRLQRELALGSPDCVLFWLDEAAAVEPTARLITWGRERGHRPLRVAAALNLDAIVESTLRSAGAHGFLPVSRRSAVLIVEALDALWPLPRDAARRAAGATAAPRIARTSKPMVAAESRADLVRPP